MRKIVVFLVVLIVGLIGLTIPLPDREVPEQSAAVPFIWDQDAIWDNLELLFLDTRASGCQTAAPQISADLDELRTILALGDVALSPEAHVWDDIEERLFSIAARTAACPAESDALANVVADLRDVVKRQSTDWDMSSVVTRQRLYRLLYGSRTAIEEVMVQSTDSSLALRVSDVAPSATPSAVIRGVRIHSGDILVSRGGYPTSALISRGSDYPGNFSHVALAHVSESGEVSVIEAHIEVGVTISPVDKYLADKKLRLMVLRLRDDLPAVANDPLIAHKAASYAMGRSQSNHIPYDFEMDYKDPAKLFCSEVASDAYGEVSVTLWTGISTISTPGLRSWLSAFGVRYFETQEPSDLEYDPQLQIVAEWRDHETLLKDRIDNVVVDALLERAEEGVELSYPWHELPFGRLAKAYSAGMNTVGKTGPVPEGMSAPSALKNKSYTAWHASIAERVTIKAESFRKDNEYEAPYWRLLELARASIE